MSKKDKADKYEECIWFEDCKECCDECDVYDNGQDTCLDENNIDIDRLDFYEAWNEYIKNWN